MPQLASRVYANYFSLQEATTQATAITTWSEDGARWVRLQERRPPVPAWDEKPPILAGYLREKALVQEARADIPKKLEKQNQNTCPAHAKRSASTLDKTIDALRGQVQDIHLRIITPTTEATMVEQGYIKRDDPRWLTQSTSRGDTKQWTSQSYPDGTKAPYTLNALLGWYDGHNS